MAGVYLTLLYGGAISGPIYSGAYCPWVSMAREAWSLSLVTCHAGFSRRGIDPVGRLQTLTNPLLARGALLFHHLHARAGDNRGSFYKK